MGSCAERRETTIDRLVYQVRNQAEDTLFDQIAVQLSDEDTERGSMRYLILLLAIVISPGLVPRRAQPLSQPSKRSVSVWFW